MHGQKEVVRDVLEVPLRYPEPAQSVPHVVEMLREDGREVGCHGFRIRSRFAHSEDLGPAPANNHGKRFTMANSATPPTGEACQTRVVPAA